MRVEQAWLIVIFGCSAASKDCPRAIATGTEMYAAREHGQRAATVGSPSPSQPHVWDQPYSGRTWYPWFYYWDPELEHARSAATGIQEGQALELEPAPHATRSPRARRHGPRSTPTRSTSHVCAMV